METNEEPASPGRASLSSLSPRRGRKGTRYGDELETPRMMTKQSLQVMTHVQRQLAKVTQSLKASEEKGEALQRRVEELEAENKLLQSRLGSEGGTRLDKLDEKDAADGPFPPRPEDEMVRLLATAGFCYGAGAMREREAMAARENTTLRTKLVEMDELCSDLQAKLMELQKPDAQNLTEALALLADKEKRCADLEAKLSAVEAAAGDTERVGASAPSGAASSGGGYRAGSPESTVHTAMLEAQLDLNQRVTAQLLARLTPRQSQEDCGGGGVEASAAT